MKNSFVIKTLKLCTFKLLILIGYSSYLLFSTLFGTFILSLVLYYFAPYIGLGEPFTTHELIIWIDQLPDNYKIATFSSLLTIFGFLIAFSMGAAQQKQHFVRQMKLDVVSEIGGFFNKASRDFISTKIFAKQIIELADKIENKTEATDLIDYCIRDMEYKVKEFKVVKVKLLEQSIEVHNFPAKHFMILESSLGASNSFDTAQKALSEMIESIHFPLPNYIDSNNLQATFMNQVDIGKCQEYIQTYDENFDLLNGSSGELKGTLVSEVTGINAFFIFNVLKRKFDWFE